MFRGWCSLVPRHLGGGGGRECLVYTVVRGNTHACICIHIIHGWTNGEANVQRLGVLDMLAHTCICIHTCTWLDPPMQRIEFCEA